MTITFDTVAESTDEALSSCCNPAADTGPAPSSCCGPEPTVEAVSSSCCGPQPETPAAGGCCASTVQTVALPVLTTSCCAAPRSTAGIRVGLGLDDAIPGDLAARLQTADTWPYALPAWLEATQHSLEGVKPWHSVAVDGDNAVFLPGFVFDAPGLVDADPRTYLGWEPTNGQAACCGVKACCGTQEQVDALGTEVLFPALVLGSPLGYRSDAIVVGDHDPQLTTDLVDALVPAALEAGIRSIVAPWVSDRPVNGPLLAALHAQGANVSFWGEENHLPIEDTSYEQHVANLSKRMRRRIKEDNDKAAATGARLVRVDGEDLRPLVGRIAELTLANRQKYDGSEGADHITALLTALIDDGADVRAQLAYKDDVIVASGVTVRQGGRLIVKWAGFDYETLGDRSGLYFSLIVNRPLKDAYAEGLDSLEIGPGVDKAKRLRGAQPRAMYTALLVADASVRDQVAGLQGTYGGARRAALEAETTQEEQASGATGVLSRLRSKKPTTEGCCG